MTTSTYDVALARVLAHEGGYSNHPSDPGGPTNFGITIHDYRKYVNPQATAADVRSIKLDEAKAIYRAKYWDALRCDELPAGLDYAVFDYGVNSGVGRAGKVLRRQLRLPDHTSAVTDEVIASARQHDCKTLIAGICDERMAFLRSLKTWPVFGAGWRRRVTEVKAAAQAMAAGGAISQGSTTASNARAPLITAAVGAVAAGTAAAGHTHHLTPVIVVVIALTIIMVTLAVARVAGWRWKKLAQHVIRQGGSDAME